MAIASAVFGRSAARLVAVVCAAQVLVQIGAFFWPALSVTTSVTVNVPGCVYVWKGEMPPACDAPSPKSHS